MKPLATRRVLPIVLVSFVVLALAIRFLGGRKDEVLDGVIVQNSAGYEFYLGATGCRPSGTRFSLLPNRDFYREVPAPTTNDFEHLEKLLHNSWRVKLRGDLTRIGRYGYDGSYSRELRVKYVIDSRQLSCGETPHD